MTLSFCIYVDEYKSEQSLILPSNNLKLHKVVKVISVASYIKLLLLFFKNVFDPFNIITEYFRYERFNPFMPIVVLAGNRLNQHNY